VAGGDAIVGVAACATEECRLDGARRAIDLAHAGGRA